jgi:hypothetical protein
MVSPHRLSSGTHWSLHLRLRDEVTFFHSSLHFTYIEQTRFAHHRLIVTSYVFAYSIMNYRDALVPYG